MFQIFRIACVLAFTTLSFALSPPQPPDLGPTCLNHGAQECIRQGESAAKDNRNAEARSFFSAACNKAKSADGCSHLAELERKLGNFGNAGAAYKRLCDLKDAAGCLHGGDQEADAKNYPAAGRLYMRACELGNGTGCLHMGYDAGHKKNFDDAKHYFDEGCSKKDPTSCVEMGNLLANLHDDDKSKIENYFKKACELDFEPGCVRRGYWLYTNGDKAESKTYFQGMCDKKRFYACFYLGEIERIEGTYDQAASHLHIGCSENIGGSCMGLARVDAKLGNKERAQTEMERAVSMLQKSCSGGNKTDCQLLKSVATARKEIEQQWSKEDTKEALKRGNTALDANHLAEARTQFLNACNKAKTVETCMPLADVELKQKNYGAAMALYRKLCDLKQGTACAHVADQERFDKNYERAVTLYTEACDLGDGRSCDVLGFTALDKKDVAEAKRRFETGCSKNDPSGCEQLGNLLVDSGETDKAKGLWKKACDLKYERGCIRLGHWEYKHENKLKAKASLQNRCDDKMSRACYSLGEIERTEGHLDKARDLFQTACGQKVGTACIALGMLDTVDGHADTAKANILKGTEILEQSCNDGDRFACSDLKVAATDMMKNMMSGKMLKKPPSPSDTEKSL